MNLKERIDALAPGDQFKLFGAAGTGKTTMAKSLASSYRSCFLAYTGKAALRMKETGCDNPSTIHRALYSFTKFGKQWVSVVDPKKYLREAELVVLDECSMCPADLAADLKSAVPSARFLILGDPCQLPPIYPENAPFHDNPDHLLTQVYRQESTSPVLEYATSVRTLERIQTPVPEGIHQFKGNLNAGFDMILCGRNATRASINERMFIARGRPTHPQRVVVANNYQHKVFNGQILPEGEPPPFPITCNRRPTTRGPVQVELGYALTVHKAQGSQWDHVLLINEAPVFRDMAWRWLYTGITRAARELTISI